MLVRDMEGFAVIGDFDAPKDERGSVGVAVVNADVFDAGAPSTKRNRRHRQRLANHTGGSIS